MSWSQIMKQFEYLVLKSNASMILGMSEDIAARRRCLSCLIATIQLLNPLGDSEVCADEKGKIKYKSGGMKAVTLLTELRKQVGNFVSGKCFSFAEDESATAEQAHDCDTVDTKKKVFVHLVLVMKDTLLCLPAELPTYFPELLNVLVSSSEVRSMQADPRSHVFAPKSFPSTEECLFVVICTQLSAAVLSRKRSVVINRIKLCPEESASYSGLVTCLADRLQFLASLIERMLRHSGSDMLEPLDHLCDVCEVCLLEDFAGYSSTMHRLEVKRRRDALIMTWERALSILVLVLTEIIVEGFNGTGSIRRCSFSNVVFSRAFSVVSAAMFQSPLIADSMARHLLPKFPLTELSILYLEGNTSYLAFLFSLMNSPTLLHEMASDTIVQEILKHLRYCLSSLHDYRSLFRPETTVEIMDSLSMNKIRNIVTGLFSSLQLLSVDFIGLDIWKVFCKTERERDSSCAFENIFNELFEELGLLQLVLGEQRLSDSSSSFDPSLDRKYIFFSRAQVENLRLHIKKLKTHMSGESMASDKTD
jgi:hypothetical protein